MTSAVALSLALVVLLSVVHRLVHGQRIGFTPLAAFGAGWILAVGLYVWNPLRYFPLSRTAWTLVVTGIVAYVAGYSVVIVVQRQTSPDQRLPESRAGAISTAPLRRVWIVSLVASVVLFAIYAAYVVVTFGVGNPATTLYKARSTLAGGAPTVGFYFFYFAELLVPTSAVLAVETGRHRYWAVSAGATLALLATTGRTNATKAVIWLVLVLLLRWGAKKIRLRSVGLMAAAFAVILGFFLVLGGGVGKTYRNSDVSTHHPVTPPPIPPILVLPYEYITAPLPTFSEVVRVDAHDEGGRNSLRPFFQVARLVDPHIAVASKVQDDRYIPYRYNVSTYLSPLWRDFGLPGVVVGSLVFGALCARAFTVWVVRRSPAALCLAALATLAAFVAAGDAQFNELSYVFQAVVLCWAIRAESAAKFVPADRVPAQVTK